MSRVGNVLALVCSSMFRALLSRENPVQPFEFGLVITDIYCHAPQWIRPAMLHIGRFGPELTTFFDDPEGFEDREGIMVSRGQGPEAVRVPGGGASRSGYRHCSSCLIACNPGPLPLPVGPEASSCSHIESIRRCVRMESLRRLCSTARARPREMPSVPVTGCSRGQYARRA